MGSAASPWSAIGLAIALAPTAASAQEMHDISVPQGRLDRAVMQLGRQAGVSIALADPGMSHVQVRGIKGRFDIRTALFRMLEGSGLGVIAIDERNFRIVKAPPSLHAMPTPRPPSKPAKAIAPAPPQEIVVTASKREMRLDDYPGAISVLAFEDSAGDVGALRGTGAIVARLPTLSSTNLGPGRNKLFIRGIADSSFTGPTQATVGQYFGYARVNYNAPDPDLELYDIAKVEVLEGPQGTLYGAGSLGGIVRIAPNVPDSEAAAGTIRAGYSVTDHGAASRDAAAMVNLPLVSDRAAIRLVAYDNVDGGYIDDVRRDLANINRSKSWGLRTALRLIPGDRWTIDAGWVRQDIQNRDGQYAVAALGEFKRASAIAQPFDNDYSLAYLTAEKKWGALVLRSTGSVLRHDLSNRFDASPLGGGEVLAYTQDLAIHQTAIETTLSRRGEGSAGWIIGASLSDGNERALRSLGDPATPAPLSGTLNERTEWALFGENSFALAPRLNLTLGGRYGRTRFSGEIVDPVNPKAPEPHHVASHFVPLVAIGWKPHPDWLVYARYQEGFRPGGLAVSGTDTATRFESDTMSTFEAGARFGRTDGALQASISASRTRWETIQADLVDAQGFPYTDNIGDGAIWGLSATTSWRPSPRLRVEASVFVNQSRLSHAAAGYERAEDNDLPNISRWGARLAAGWVGDLGGGYRLSIDANARYVGPSYLGVGELLDIKQGKYVDTSLSARLERGRLGLSLGMTNLFNADRNRFSYGNPFSLLAERQLTPLRPRTIRIGLDAAF